MVKHRALLLGLFLLLLAVDWSLADSQVNESGKGGQDPAFNGTMKGDVETSPSKDDKGSDKGTNPIVDSKEKKDVGGNDGRSEGDNQGKGDGGDGVNKDELGAQARGKGSGNEGKGEGDVNSSGSAGGKNEKVKGNDSGGGGKPEPKAGSKDKGKDVVSKDNVPKDEEGSVDQCDPSATCKIEKKKFVACLRGTGNESPEFSLLVRNDGEQGLEITVSGPEFVHLENKTVQVDGKAKQEVKMKVETNTGGGNNLISLQVGKETCNLNITEFVARIYEKDVDGSSKSLAVNLLKAPTIAVILFAALLILASAWTFISLRRKLLSKNGSKYQRIEPELPVSAARQTEPASNDAWDNNWGDDWDDEEAPLTPSVHLTPTLSSKGLASRRLNKDGWKD